MMIAMYRFKFVACLAYLISAVVVYADKPKILHLSYHLGTIKEIETIAQKLDLDVTSWFIFGQPLEQFEGCNSGLNVYNISPDRAERIWNKHKDYFNQFDVIMTSDTAPLSRIFLQHNWQKPLIIWVCNRFDWAYNSPSFPDEGLYKMFKDALKKENVFLIPFSSYEWFHCYKRGVRPKLPVIWPIGSEETTQRYTEPGWSVPGNIKKNELLLIDPHIKNEKAQFVMHAFKRFNIKAYAGKYNGPQDIKDFKGVCFWPYQWANMCFFENIKRGLVHFLPSPTFLKKLVVHGAPVYRLMKSMVEDRSYEMNMWYCPEFEDAMIYYDSWHDLKHKVETTDYDAMKEKIMAIAEQHEQEMLNRWRMIIDDVY